MTEEKEALWDKAVEETEAKFGSKTYEWVRGDELFTTEAGDYLEDRFQELLKAAGLNREG